MNRGTEFYYLWDATVLRSDVVQIINSYICQDGAGRRTSDFFWEHATYGRIVGLFRGAGEDTDCVFLRLTECELLPELAAEAPPEMQGSERTCREAYHWLKELFFGLSCSDCSGATSRDGVALFDFEDPFITRLFRFSKHGSQKLIRPYEEHRSISIDDIRPNPQTGEPNWVMRFEGPLTIPG